VAELPLFDEVADVLRGLVPRGLGELRCRPRRHGIKAWFGPEAPDKPPREHYEAQVIGAQYVPAASALALEIGFHAEHRDEVENKAVLARLLACRDRWGAELGEEAVAGPFLGRAGAWRRISETWLDPDLGEVGLAFEVAARLTDYVTALEPVRRRG